MTSGQSSGVDARQWLQYAKTACQELQRVQDSYESLQSEFAVRELQSGLIDHVRFVLNGILVNPKLKLPETHEVAADILCTAVRLSEHHFERGDRIEWMLAAAESVGKFRDTHLAGRLLGNLGNALAATGRLKEAEEFLNQRMAFAIRGDNLGTINLAKEHIGKLKLRQGYIDTAELLLLEAYNFAVASNDAKSALRLLKDVADAALRRGETDKGIDFLRERIDLCKKAGDIFLEFSSTQVLAERLIIVARLQEAKETAFVALELCKKLRRPFLRANMMGTLGNILYDEGDFTNSHVHFLKARRIYQKLGRVVEIGRTSTSLGLIAWKQGRMKQGEKYFREALQIDRETGQLRDVATDLGNLAGVLGQSGNIEESVMLYEERIKLLAEIGDLATITSTERDLEAVQSLLMRKKRNQSRQ